MIVFVLKRVASLPKNGPILVRSIVRFEFEFLVVSEFEFQRLSLQCLVTCTNFEILVYRRHWRKGTLFHTREFLTGAALTKLQRVIRLSGALVATGLYTQLLPSTVFFVLILLHSAARQSTYR